MRLAACCQKAAAGAAYRGPYLFAEAAAPKKRALMCRCAGHQAGSKREARGAAAHERLEAKPESAVEELSFMLKRVNVVNIVNIV